MRREAAAANRRLTWLVLALAVVVWGAARGLAWGERVVHVALHCDAQRCRASLGGHEALSVARAGGRSTGLYIFVPWESTTEQHFRNLVVKRPNRLPARYSLLYGQDAPHEFLKRGWAINPGVGLSSREPPGGRAVALFDAPTSDTFSMEVDLVAAADAGLIFDASGPSSGRVFVVRPRFNDAFFFDLENGEPGGVLALTELRQLAPVRALARLGGVAAEILLSGAVFVGLARWLARRFPGRPRPWLWPTRHRPPAWCIALLLVVTFGAMAAISLLGFSAVPHIADEIVYLFQAKIFAAGALWAPAPPEPEFFRHEHMIVEGGHWFGKYPPLFPALLALGVLAGAPWIVNPVLGALTGYVIYLLARDLAGWRAALGAWLLTLSSPFFMIMGGTLMAHMTSALFTSLFLWLVLRALARGSRLLGVLAGACLGLALGTRPFVAFLAAWALAIYGVFVWVRRAGRRRTVAGVLVYVAAGALPLVLGFLGWNGLYDDSARLAVGQYSSYDGHDRLGFGPDRGAGWLETWGSWGHTPGKAFRSAHQYLEYTSRHLLGWPLRLSFALTLAPFLARRRPREVWLLAALFGALVVGHLFYWATQHLAYGARYWFSAMPALMALSAVGLRSIVRGSRASASGARLVAALILVLMLVNFTTYLPGRLRELPHYANIGAELKRKVERLGLHDAVIFVHTEGLQYNDGFFMNDPFLTRGPIFARDLGPRDGELLRCYPALRAYRWSGGILEPFREPAGAGRAMPAAREGPR